ncbi:uncharacterized protein LOC117110235 [Anneissia japonica]|uniref:uncharacterized protein LOC117110235 n=1 Tax=Anneissia japonica TaxID=1529436 RepID=UPI001425713C|nr:uncharacterized protein LOC117110235 [Anneissia japonica]
MFLPRSTSAKLVCEGVELCLIMRKKNKKKTVLTKFGPCRWALFLLLHHHMIKLFRLYGTGCDCGDDIYSLIHLSRDIKRFRVNTSLDFLTDYEYVHFLFTSNFSINTFAFDIEVKKQNPVGFKIKSTSFDSTTEFETTFDACNISVGYQNGYIMINRTNGLTILQSQMSTSRPIYFWYGKNIQISECSTVLSDECSAEYSDTTNQLLEVKCPMNKCNWKIQNNVFEKCDANCTHKIANCADYLTWYNDSGTFDTWTQLQMITDDNAQTQNRVISTADLKWTEPQHVSQQYNTTSYQRENITTIGDNINTIGEYVSGDSDNTDTPISFGQPVMTAMRTEYRKTSHRPAQMTETSTENGNTSSCQIHS